ncbi:tubulin nucleotide-binding domain-like protein [Chiua virens]|nr:tubulin nucleotide-binding domain-like protein [Chiua virens]
MREIVHIQAGSLSNYTGTHYWNTQESYFVYDERDVPITDYNISFKEGRDHHNEPTLFPRLLSFDQKSNFGTLSTDLHQEEALTLPTTWQGDVIREEQERIPQSEYHSLLEEDSEQLEVKPIATKIRYWSDFSRVLFDPKSIQAVPDVPKFVENDWNTSRETFTRYDNDMELMDGSLRLLVEDCDNFQGVQMIQDTSIFGGFSDSLLTAFRAEHPKATLLTFACLSSISPLDANLGDSSQIKQVLNDALSLRSAADICDLTVPILSPPQWEKSTWFSGHNVNVRRRHHHLVTSEAKQRQVKSLYRSSAILSTHIETVTLPLRLMGSLDDLQTMVAHLNWRKTSPVAVLRGTLYPHGLSTQNLQDLPSMSFRSSCRPLFARRDVSRGLSQNEVAIYDAWGNTHEPKRPFLMWHHLPSYPIPTSFPPIFPDTQPTTLKSVSSMSTTPSTSGHLSDYAHFVENAAKRRDSALLAMGLEEDELKELVSDLWDIVDGYGDNEEGGG